LSPYHSKVKMVPKFKRVTWNTDHVPFQTICKHLTTTCHDESVCQASGKKAMLILTLALQILVVTCKQRAKINHIIGMSIINIHFQFAYTLHSSLMKVNWCFLCFPCVNCLKLNCAFTVRSDLHDGVKYNSIFSFHRSMFPIHYWYATFIGLLWRSRVVNWWTPTVKWFSIKNTLVFGQSLTVLELTGSDIDIKVL